MAHPATTRPPQLTPRAYDARDDWNRRAKEIYRARTVLYGWRRLPMAARPGVEMFVVLSGEQHDTYAGPRHMATREHMVRYIQATGEVRCDCQASVFNSPCFHAGQVLAIKEREKHSLERTAS